jgi:hypothetical protein
LIRRATLHCTHTHTIKAKLNLAAWAPHSSERAAATNKKRAGLASSQSIQTLYWAIHTHTWKETCETDSNVQLAFPIYIQRKRGLSRTSLCTNAGLVHFPYSPPLFSFSVRPCLYIRSSQLLWIIRQPSGRYT